MKGCLKFIIYGIIGVIGLAIVYSILVPKDESKTNEIVNEVEEVYPETENYENNSIDNNDTDITEHRELADIWVGNWNGKENCSMGRNANQWSNDYKIHFRMVNNLAYLRGLYFQANQEIVAEITENEIYIKQQNIGDTDFKITGTGKIEDGELILQYQVDILIDENYETNFCTAKFKKKVPGVSEFEIKKQSTMAIWLPENGQWCLWEIKGDDRIWLEGNVPNNGYAKFDVASDQLPMFLGYEKKFKATTNFNDIILIFKKCERE